MNELPVEEKAFVTSRHLPKGGRRLHFLCVEKVDDC